VKRAGPLAAALALGVALRAPVARGAEPLSTTQQDEDYAQAVEVKGAGWASPRGLGDVRVKRELLQASPRQLTSELLSSAPGFFVDHEDGEGLGNDVYLRGFDLDHGSGVEMRLGSIPINAPLHIQGQGYADANFIIPEVVRSIRVLEGPYDPRQGDAAIVGSANFDLGVVERGYHASAAFGSFDQSRVVAVLAPRDADDETFAAVALRETRGFGQNRAGQSGSMNAQYAIDLGPSDRVRLVATAYSATTGLAGVVRQDDVDAGRIDYYGTYPHYAGGQGVRASRVVAGADFDHAMPGGARLEIAPWVMATDFGARQNYTGNLQSSRMDPAVSGRGDLFETTNLEGAAGLSSRLHSTPWRVGPGVEVVAEPGVFARAGHTRQTKSLLDPTTLERWDRRTDATLGTFDAAAYLDLDVRVGKRLRVSGGPRVDVLAVSVDDFIAGSRRDVAGVVVGPHVTVAYDLGFGVVPVVSYGEGFRSLDAAHVQDGAQPYSRVRSVEAGVRAQSPSERVTATASVFETWVANELVFDATTGGLETEAASTRKGVVGSIVARPLDWLLASSSLSVTSATYATLVAGLSHYVPSVPAVLFRVDATARGVLLEVGGKPVVGRVGAGYTLLGGRHLTDTVLGATTHALNVGAGLRRGALELGVEAYNVLGLMYPDDEQIYVSNWSLSPGQQAASVGRHVVAAPPRSVLVTLAAHF
jgi:iron complex outermembrane receptor protein